MKQYRGQGAICGSETTGGDACGSILNVAPVCLRSVVVVAVSTVVLTRIKPVLCMPRTYVFCC